MVAEKRRRHLLDLVNARYHALLSDEKHTACAFIPCYVEDCECSAVEKQLDEYKGNAEVDAFTELPETMWEEIMDGGLREAIEEIESKAKSWLNTALINSICGNAECDDPGSDATLATGNNSPDGASEYYE